MSISANKLAKLEVEFCDKLYTIIDQLVRNDFAEADMLNFTKSVKTFLKHKELKQYIKTALYDKALELSNIYLVMNKSLAFRKFLSILISLNEEEVMEILETSFAKKRNFNNFFTLIQEEIKAGKDISNCENLFLSLMTLQCIPISVSNSFLESINKNKNYIIEKLIQSQSYSTLRVYIEDLAISDIQNLNDIVPVILEKYNDKISNHYIDLIRTIVSYSNNFTFQLLPTNNLRKIFQAHLINNHISCGEVIKNYSMFLFSLNEELFSKFENEFLKKADSDNIVKFSLNVPFSNKRILLNRLVELQDSNEDALVFFCKKFPEYDNLLPLL